MRTPTRCGLVGSVLGCVGWACTTAVRAVGGGLVRPGSEHDDTAQAARCWMVFTRVQAGKRGRARAAGWRWAPAWPAGHWKRRAPHGDAQPGKGRASTLRGIAAPKA